MAEFGAEFMDSAKATQILDVGSFDENGSYRALFGQPPWTYVGCDIQPGRNVDIVLPDPYDWQLEPESYDVVVSGQCMEHVPDLASWARAAARVLRSGGLMCLIAPWQQDEHRYPLDCWRILPDGMAWLLRDVAGLEVLKAFKQDIDCVGIARKPVG